MNQISRELKISVGSAYKILKSLERKGVLVSQKIGNGIYYVLNTDSKEAASITELVLMESRNKSLSKNSLASIYAKDLRDAEKLSKAIIIFGSILDTRAAKDVDALFIIDKGKSKAVEDFCLKLSNLRPKRVNPLLMTVVDFKENIKKKDKVIVDILKRGLILFGEDVLIDILRGV
ncbi:MAG: winged helix-turn-helix domain-containing protein [Candidatus Omnitrophota bacterium]